MNFPPSPLTSQLYPLPVSPRAQLSHPCTMMRLPPPRAVCSYVFLVPLPALQLLLEAPSCPQPLLGQVPDPLLHEAEGLLARADQLQEASQVTPESCLGKEHALRFECRESSHKRSPWVAMGAGGGLPIVAKVP